MTRETWTTAATYMVGGAVGLIVFFVATDPSFLAPDSPRWLRPSGDLGTYQTASLYFVHDRWRLPLLSVPAMGYPDGGSVIFNDAVPLGALIAKITYTATGIVVNHLPWALLVAYVLQGAMAVRLIRALGYRVFWLTPLIASWAVLSIPFLLRFVHIALSFQGLLLWAMALYFEQVRANRVRVTEQILLGVIGLLINPYLLAMVVLILGTIWVTLCLGRALSLRDLLRGVAMTAIWGLLAWACGYFAVSDASVLSTGGHGVFSWNLASFVTAPGSIQWAHPFGSVTRDATGGQYEGESYPGVGVLIVMLLCLLTRRVEVGRALKDHWILCAVLAACAAFAASDQLYLGSHKILSADLPRWAEGATGLFRSQGRFIWPLTYAVTLAPIVLVLDRRRLTVAVALVTMVTVTKVAEAQPFLQWARDMSVKLDPDLISTPQFTTWMQGHERVWQFPSWFCGGVNSSRETAARAQQIQIQLQLLAARLGLPNNSIYMSRSIKDCRPESRWAAHPTLLRGTFYIFVKTRAASLQHLDQLLHGPNCRDVDWAYVCSRQWNLDAGDRSAAAQGSQE